MPCHEHPSGVSGDEVPAGTAVYLSKKPKNPTSPVKIYVWLDVKKGCAAHTKPAEPNFRFTHRAKLKRAIAGFVTAGLCQGPKGKRVLYIYAGSGADVTTVAPDATSVCEG